MYSEMTVSIPEVELFFVAFIYGSTNFDNCEYSSDLQKMFSELKRFEKMLYWLNKLFKSW
jgi:hypothetical protein